MLQIDFNDQFQTNVYKFKISDAEIQIGVVIIRVNQIHIY